MEDEFLSLEEMDTPETADDIGGLNESVDTGDVARGVRLARGTEYGFGSKVIAGTIGALPDVVDTVSSSVGLTERGDLTKGFYEDFLPSIGAPNLGQWYEGNKGAMEIGSGIGMVIAADYAAGRFLRPAGAAMQFLKGKPFVGAVAELEKGYSQAMRVAQGVNQRLAATGAMGVDQYTTGLTISRLGKPATELSGNQARNIFYKQAVSKGLARNLTTEAILGITANESFLYEGDMGDTMALMAFGLAGGAVFDGLMASHALRRSANSDRVGRAMTKAYDPFGTETARIQSSLRNVSLSGNSAIENSNGVYTDMATSFAISAAEGRNPLAEGIGEAGEKSRLFGRRQSLATGQTDESMNWFQKATAKGLGGGKAGFSLATPGLGNAFKHMVYKDSAAFYGAEEFAAARGGESLVDHILQRETGIKDRMNEIKQMLDQDGVPYKSTQKTKDGSGREAVVKIRPFEPGEADGLRAELRASEERLQRVEMWAIDGELVPGPTGRKFANWQEPTLKWDAKEEGLLTAEVSDGHAKLGLYRDGRVIFPKGKGLKNLSLFESIALHRLGNRQIDSIINTKDAKFMVPAKADWFQLDMADEIIKRSGDESKVVWPAGFNRDVARKESFLLKAKELAATKALQSNDPVALAEARIKWNLPRLTAYEAGLLMKDENPAEILLRGLQNIEKPERLSYGELVQGLKDGRQIAGLTDEAFDRTDELVGNGFKFMMDDRGMPMTPFATFKRPPEKFSWTRDDLATRLAAHKVAFRGVIQGPDAGEMTRALGEVIYGAPEFTQVSQVSSLTDAQILSSIPGLGGKAPQTTTGSLLNDVTQREWRDRENATLLAASRLNDMIDRQTRSIMDQKIRGHLGDVVDRINGPRSGDSKLLVNQFLTFRSGWDLKVEKRAVVTKKAYPPQGKALTQFVLDGKSEANKTRWRKTFGTEMPENAMLTAPNGTVIGVDDLGYEFVQRLSNLAVDINREKNTLLKANGLREINTQPLYAPPPNTKGKYIAFVLDDNNRPVPNGAIVAATPEEFAKKRAWLENIEKNPDSPLHKPGARLVEKDDIEDFNSLWDEAQMDFMDPGTTAIQPGKKGAGTLLGQVVNPNAVEDALLWTRDSYLKHAHDLKASVFKDQISAAKQRSMVAKESKPKGRDGETRSIYDYYIENLMGYSSLASDASVVGRTYRSWESKINDLLAERSPHPSRIMTAANEWVKNWNPRAAGTDESKKAFDTLVEKMGAYSPFKSVSEMLESQTTAKRPKELAEITGAMSRFEATMRLRVGEWVHGMMNVAGILNSTPAVIRSFQPLPNETTEEFAKRIGWAASMMDLGNGKRIGTLNMPKLIHETMKMAWSGKGGDLDWAYMKSMGYTSQEVAEFHRQFGSIDSKSRWQKFMFGEGGQTLNNTLLKKDSLATKGEKLVQRRGVVGWASVLSDKSEDFSRTWAHLIGVKVAKGLGIEGKEAIHSFAHDVANKMIANYDPKNRPAIFQGAVGAPFGLFQSFMWNYYQRMFRYVETGQTRALATQAAMQSGLFGLSTVPGAQAINGIWGMTHDNQSTPIDAFYERFGEEAGDFLLGGVLSNFTKLANLLPGEQGIDGIAFYSRGDTNIRAPFLNPPPIFDTAKRGWEALKQVGSMVSNSNPNFTPRQIAEVMSNLITNRPMAGWIETLGAGGMDTDGYGQVVSQNLGYAEAFARVSGVRSLRQQKELESYYARKDAMEAQNAMRQELNVSARAAIRAGDIESLPDYYSEYVKRGGDPRRFTRWMKDNYEAATESRGESMLDDFSKSPTKVGQMNALLNMDVNLDDYNPGAFEPPPVVGDNVATPLIDETTDTFTE